jgi:hypothetical protein
MVGMWWQGWLRHCATSKQVTGLNADGVTGIFQWHNPYGPTTTLGSTPPLTEMSSRNISWGVKAVGAWDWQPYHLHVLTVMKSGSLNLLKPSGPVQACTGTALPLYFTFNSWLVQSYQLTHIPTILYIAKSTYDHYKIYSLSKTRNT